MTILFTSTLCCRVTSDRDLTFLVPIECDFRLKCCYTKRPRLSGARSLRRTCARLCHLSGGELEQIQFLLGHVSVQTTEKYLGCKQKLREAVNDLIGLGAAKELVLPGTEQL